MEGPGIIEKAVDLLVYIKRRIGSRNLGNVKRLPFHNAGFKKILRDPNDVFHVPVKQILLQPGLVMLRRRHLMELPQIRFQSLRKASPVFIDHSDPHAFRLVAARRIRA